VEVVRMPTHPLEVPSCLDRLARLEIISLTEEDRAKTQMYVHERQRKELERDISLRGGDLGDYLRSLDMRMQIEVDDRRQLGRLAQLTQKTNQFNLTTRRYSEEQMRRFVDSPETLVGHFALSDRFGNSGVVGLAILRKLSTDAANLDTFLMSCRVIGRSAESAFLEALLHKIAEEGMGVVFAEFIPTAKNALVKEFLPSHGFVQQADGSWKRDLRERPPRPLSDLPIEVVLALSAPG
jgi:FkbH-like protein